MLIRVPLFERGWRVPLYGLYPAMVNYPCDRKYLENFVDSLIFKDLLELQLIDNRRVALQLLKLLAYLLICDRMRALFLKTLLSSSA